MKKSMIFVGMLAIGYANAQEGTVGINTDSPKATLDIQPNTENAKETATTNEGIIAPRLSKERIANIESSKLTEGTLVYATNNVYAGTNDKVSKITEKGYYFYNGTEWVRVQYKDTNDAEWVYDDATKRINLKRSGQSTDFTNKVFYDVQTGQFVNTHDETLNREGNFIHTQANSSKIAERVFPNNQTRKDFYNNHFIIDEKVSKTELHSTVLSNFLDIAENNTSSVFYGTGASGYIQKKSSIKDGNLAGGRNGMDIQNGDVGFAIGTASSVVVNSPQPFTGTLMGMYSNVSAGGASSSIKRMVGIESYMGFNYQSGSKPKTVEENISLFEGRYGALVNVTAENMMGFYYKGLSELNAPNIKNHYGLYMSNVQGAQNNYAVYTNAGKFRVGDLAQSGAGDRVVYADENGVLKTGGSIASNNGVQNETGMTCTAANAGKINYTTIQKDGKDVGVFGFCMQKGTDYVWAYMLGGSNIYGTSANGAAFGQGL